MYVDSAAKVTGGWKTADSARHACRVLERLRDQDDLQVADVGIGRAGLDEIAKAIEELVAVVLVQIGARVKPAVRARSAVARSTMAPAASVGPSMPSVPRLAAATFHAVAEASASASANANS